MRKVLGILHPTPPPPPPPPHTHTHTHTGTHACSHTHTHNAHMLTYIHTTRLFEINFWHACDRVDELFCALEVFIEDIPRTERLGYVYSAATIDVASLHRISHILCSCMAIYIQGVGVTAYRIIIQQRAYCEAEEVGPNVTINRK